MIHHLKNNWAAYVLLVMSILIHHVWMFRTDYITHGDTSVWILETQKELIVNSLSAYTTNVSLGTLSLSGGFNSIMVVYGFLAEMGIDYNLALRIMILWPYVIAAPIITYLFTKKFFKTQLACLIAGFVMLFNTYTLLISTGHLLVLIGDMLFLLFFHFLHQFFEFNKKRYLVGTVLTGIVFAAYEFRIFYIAVIFCSLFLIYRLCAVKFQWRQIIDWIIILVIIGLANIYWLIPVATSGSLANNALFSRGLFGDSYFDIQSAITLFHRFWTGSKTAVFITQPIPFYFWLIPLTAFAGFYVKKHKPYVLFFVVMAFLGIFLTKQSDVPFSTTYQWLYSHIPGFNAFREASKFYIITVIAYSVLIGFFVDWLWTTQRNISKHIRYAITVIIAIVFLWNLKPMINGSIETLYVPRSKPEDYVKLNTFLNNQSEYFRVLAVPVDSRWMVYTNTHPLVRFAEATETTWLPLTKNKPNFFDLSLADNLLDLSSFKYVIVPIKDVQNDDNFFQFYKPRETYISTLNKKPYLKRVSLGTADLAVYENTDFYPLIYTTKEKVNLKEKPSFQQVSYKRISPSHYEIRVENISENTYLHFSQLYHPDWKLRVGSLDQWSVVKQSNYFYPEQYHIQNEAQLNSYFLDLNTIKNSSQYAFEQNPNGSINLNINLYFKPQASMNIGLLISAISVVIGLIYIVFIKKYSQSQHQL